eukprot:6482180-Amphidinium_carterae.1
MFSGEVPCQRESASHELGARRAVYRELPPSNDLGGGLSGARQPLEGRPNFLGKPTVPSYQIFPNARDGQALWP